MTVCIGVRRRSAEAPRGSGRWRSGVRPASYTMGRQAPTWLREDGHPLSCSPGVTRSDDAAYPGSRGEGDPVSACIRCPGRPADHDHAERATSHRLRLGGCCTPLLECTRELRRASSRLPRGGTLRARYDPDRHRSAPPSRHALGGSTRSRNAVMQGPRLSARRRAASMDAVASSGSKLS